MDPIKFFDKSSPYFEFSNYYRTTFILEDRVWYSVESYYQSQKFNTPETQTYYRLIAKADSPQKAKDMGSQRPNPRGKTWLINKSFPALGKMNDCILEFKGDDRIRPDWEEVKISVMKKGLYAKFTQNPGLQESLLSTDDREIMENSPYDSFWGIGPQGNGQNQLGKLLMRLRSHLRNHP
jgi:N-glycosidase YbiA